MADSFSGNLNLTLPEVGFATNTWGGTSGLNRDLTILDSLFQSNGLSTAGPIAGSGHPNAGVPGVGLRVGIGYTLNVEGFALFKDHTDVTKVATLDSSLITTATTRTYKFPDANGTFALQTDVRMYSPTGTIISGYFGTAPPGFVMADGRTIGDATSGAVNRANADTVNLYTLLWTLGSIPTGGRGASAAADYAAHKPMPVPNHSGRVMAGRDNLSGTAASVMPGLNTAGMIAGSANNTAGMTNIAVSGSASGTTGGPSLTTGLQGGPGSTADAVHTHNFSGAVTALANGTTNSFSVVQPTIAVDVVIAL